MPRAKKPEKFPLRFHHTGQWTKNIRGKQYYFGKDKDAALREYVRIRDDLEAGRQPQQATADGLTIMELCNQYLTARRRDVESGELSSRTWGDYHKTCERILKKFDGNRRVDDLKPEDFGQLRASVAKKYGPISVGKVVQYTKTIFLFAYESGLIDRPIRYGSLFDRPARRVIRLQKAKMSAKLIAAEDARLMIEKADPQLKAMMLLGLNCAYGQGDCSALNRSMLAKRPGWIDFPRPKTGIARRSPLWPETIAALKAVEAVRPAPRDPVDADAVFLTRQGVRWVRWIDAGDEKVGTRRDSVADAFHRLAKSLGLSVPGGPYVLRHTFRTVADRMPDFPAINLLMGHNDASMAAQYRQSIDDDRLVAIVEHVRRWLFGTVPHGPQINPEDAVAA